MNTVKKRKRLLVQVSLLLLVVFIVTFTLIGVVVTKGMKNVYLRSKEEMMDKDLMKFTKDLTDIAGLSKIIKYWENDPGKMETKLTDKESDLLHDELSFSPTEEEINNASETSLRNYAWQQLQMLALVYAYYVNNGAYSNIQLIDVSQKDAPVILADGKRDAEVYDVEDFTFTVILGESPDLTQYPSFDKIVNSNEQIRSLYEDTSPGKGEHYYVGYKPVYIDGKLKCILCLTYDCTEYYGTLNAYFILNVLFGMAVLVLANLFVLMYLNRKAIRPLSEINKGVIDYMNDKDSSAVCEKMSRIKTNNEIEKLSEIFSELALEIDRYNEENLKLNSEREHAIAEMSMASDIQSSQLPSKFPAFPDRDEFELFASMTPAKEVGGDFYDFFLIDNDHLGLVMADVSDKGVPAALFMMMSKMLINNYAMEGFTPLEVIRKTNETICKNNTAKMFVTVWFGILEIPTGKVRAVNAGHEYPAIKHGSGEFELFKDKHGLVVGAKKNLRSYEYEFTLEEGSTLFLYTDGVAEATDSELQLFGTSRMIEALNRQPDAAPEKLLENVRSAVNEFVGDAPQFDDLTMLAVTIKRTGSPASDAVTEPGT